MRSHKMIALRSILIAFCFPAGTLLAQTLPQSQPATEQTETGQTSSNDTTSERVVVPSIVRLRPATESALDTSTNDVIATTGTADPASAFIIRNSASTELFRIRSDGHVGIGTTAPATDFHVISNTSLSRGVWIDQYSNDGNAALVVLRKARGTLAVPTGVLQGDYIANLYTQVFDGSSWLHSGRVRFAVDGPVSAGHVPTALQFLTGDGSVVGGMERMRIASNGYVGIGTTPLAPLHVNGAPSRSQLVLTNSTLNTGLLSSLAYSADNVSVSFDVDYSSSAWIARAPSVAWLYKTNGHFMLMGSGANAINGGATQNNYQDTDLATGTTTFRALSVPNTSATIAGGTVALAGYPTKIAFGNGQFIQDNAGGNLRIFGGFDLSMDTSAGDIVMTPASAQTRVNGNLIATNSLTVGQGACCDQTTRFTVHGSVVIDGNIAAKYQDVAEWVPATVEMPPGTVVILNPEKVNEVMPSNHAYDTTVAGVVSQQPGVILGEAAPTKAKIATTGRVKVRVDASSDPIRIGDLLVSSDKPGMAMKSIPIEIDRRKFHQPGTVIGKALEPLERGEGEILVLLTLQ